MKKIAVVGSRSFDNYLLLRNYLLNYFHPFILISGGAQGADSLAESFADNKHLKKNIYRAEWDKYGKSAGPIRNKKMVEDADIIVAFWDGESKGTKMTIDYAKEKGKPVYVVMYPDKDM